jgi:hypothetical protein
MYSVSGQQHVEFPAPHVATADTAQQGELADLRRLSVSSRTSQPSSPTQGLVPTSATEHYLQRFQSWLGTVKQLMVFFEAFVDQERKTADLQLRRAKDMATGGLDTAESFQVGSMTDI